MFSCILHSYSIYSYSSGIFLCVLQMPAPHKHIEHIEATCGVWCKITVVCLDLSNFERNFTWFHMIWHDLTWLSWFHCFRCFRQMNLRIRFLQNRLRACWQRADNMKRMSRMSRMSCGEQRRMCPIRYHCSHQAGEGRPKDRRETEGNSFRTENARAKAI